MANASVPQAMDPVDEPSVEPIPPRYWWLKRILVVSGVLLVGLVVLRVWWGWDAHRRLQAEIDRCIAAGEPIYTADFNPKPVPDDENAAKLLQDAELALNLTPEQTELIGKLARDPAAVEANADQLRPIIQANRGALDLVRQAGSLDQVDWGFRVKSPAINSLFPSLSGQRAIAKFLATIATYQHTTTNDRAALDTIRDAFAQTETVDAHAFLICHLVAIACRALAVRQIEWIAPSLRVSAETVGPHETREGPASPAQVRLLITDLLAEDSLQQAHIRTLWSERMAQLDSLQLIKRGDFTLSGLAGAPAIGVAAIGERILTLAFMPVVELDGLWAFRHLSSLAESVHEPVWPAASASFPPELADRSTILQILKHPISGRMMLSFSRVIYMHYRLLAEQRMAAIALAIRLFEVDHGHRPRGLAELVPHYLPALPLDPFAEDGTPLRYRPEATPPLLYSVNRDGQDDGGQFVLHANGHVKTDSLDLVFFLDGDRPRPPREKEEETSPRSPDVEDENRDAEDGNGNQAKH